MSNEPGLTLGRIVAAERNALAAIESVNNLRTELNTFQLRVSGLESKVIQMADEMRSLRLLVVQSLGSGPTSVQRKLGH